jgi:hypothetical protein
MGTTLLFEYFNKHFKRTIATRHVREIESIVTDFEIRNDHSLALNTPLLGVYKIVFTDKDRAAIFDTFDMKESDIKNAIKKEVLLENGRPLIPEDWNVQGDPCNLLCVWIMYLTFNSKELSKQQQYKMLFNIGKLLIYKFFTSLLFRRFYHGVNEEVMKATIDSLDNKSDIIRYGTWKKLIEAQVEKLISPDSIHSKSLRTFKNDEEVLYVLTNSQTSIRNKINHLYSDFKNIKESGDIIGSYGTVGELEGVKVVIDKVSKYDAMINSMLNEVININAFINDKYVRLISSLFKNISNDLLVHTLNKFSSMASIQNKSGDRDKIITKNGETIYVGYRVLVSNIIQKSYRYCFKKNIKFTSHVHILNQIKNIYSSSRISDPDLSAVKESVSYFIDNQRISTRQATNSSLKLAFIMYIITKTFRYISKP